MASLVIGLGNPGRRYAATRHNLGWMCLDQLQLQGKFSKPKVEGSALITHGEIEGFEMILGWPQTYMNLSGKAVRYLADKYGVLPTEVIVVHDEIDLPLGRLRLRRDGSAAGHRGVKSLIAELGTKDFIRVRMGAGRPANDKDIEDYVLEKFAKSEKELLPEVIDRSAAAVIAVVSRGLEVAMMEFNRTPDA